MRPLKLIAYKTRPTLGLQVTLGRLSSINHKWLTALPTEHRPANFESFEEKPISIIESVIYINIYIYIYICVCVCGKFLAPHFNDLSRCRPISKFTDRAIIGELSMRRRLCTFLIRWRQKMRIKYYYADLSSWYEFWLEIICFDMNVILDLFTTFQQFQRRFRLPVNGSTRRIFFYWNTTTANNSITDVSLLRKNVKIKCKEYFSYPTLACRSEIKQSGTSRSFGSFTYHISQLTAGSWSGIISSTERILDNNARSLYRRIF